MNKSVSIIATIISVLIIFSVFQNCAEVQFSTPLDNSGEQSLGNEKTERLVELVPSPTEMLPQVPFKVLLVIDSSVSMAQNYQKLEDNIDAFLQPLNTRDVVIKLISTSDLRKTKNLDGEGWTVSTSNLNERLNVSTYFQNKFQMSSNDKFIYGYDVYHHLNDKNIFRFSAGAPNLMSEIAKLKNAVLNMSSSEQGDDIEQGLCNSLLALYDEGPNRFFHEKDKAAVIIISDEDDSSVWHRDPFEIRKNCSNRYTYGMFGDPLGAKSKSVNYELRHWAIRFTVDREVLNDGVWEAKQAGRDNGGIPIASTSLQRVQGLVAGDTLSCNAGDLEKVMSYAKHLYPSSKNRNHVIKDCRIESTWTALWNFGPEGKDYCTQSFEDKGETYTDIYDFFNRGVGKVLVPNTCKRRVVERVDGTKFSDFYIYNSNDSNILNAKLQNQSEQRAAIKTSIVNRANELFGEDNYLFSMIVNKDETCTANNQQVGVNYLNLKNFLNNDDAFVSYSICDPLNNVFADLGKKVGTIASNKVDFNLINGDESIARVYLIRTGNLIELQEGKDYQLVEETINNQIKKYLVFTDNLLEVTDLINVVLVKQ